MRFAHLLDDQKLLIFGLLVLSCNGAIAQSTVDFSQGIPLAGTPTPLQCTEYRSARDRSPAITQASLVIADGELKVISGGKVVFGIPTAAEREQLMRKNGTRPGVDYHYLVDQSATGIGYFWFETRYASEGAPPETRRNELFADEDGAIVSYTFEAKLRASDPVAGVREFTIRCEPELGAS